MNPDKLTRGRLAGLFLLGLVLFLPPLVGLAGPGTVLGITVLGIPALFVTVYAAWALVILLLALILHRARAAGETERR